jgi:diguanylate cyclase (GGDEF)-like protein
LLVFALAGGKQETAVPARRVALLGQVLLFAAVYFVAARLSLSLAIPPGYATAVWPPSGIALAVTLLLGNRIWPGIWLGATLANLTVASAPIAAVLIGTGNTLEALAGAALIRRFVGIPYRFERAGDVVKFVAFAALSSTIAATIAVGSLALEGSVAWPRFLPNWWTWWQGDATGIIIVTPLILSWSGRKSAVWPPKKKAEAACFGVLLLIVTYGVFGDATGIFSPFPLSFAIFPFIIWAALSFSQRVVTAAIAVVCAFAIHYTLEGLGPFALWSVNESLLLLLAYISIVVVTGLVLSAVLIERSRALDRLAQALSQVREQAITDPLTGLYNRRFLREFLRREWVRAKRRDAPLAVVMLDLDHFKRINDAFGHQAGDFALTAIAGLLRTHIRSSDIVCRYGGEEFALVLPEASSKSVRARAEDIRAAIKRLDLRHQDAPLGRITASLGVALFPDHADSPDSLLRAADAALYEAKRAGRNRVVFSPAARRSSTRARQTARA